MKVTDGDKVAAAVLALAANAGDKTSETFVTVYFDLLERIMAGKNKKTRAKRVPA
jgi:hypothetical protein